MSAAIFVAARRLRCRRFDSIMESGWQCVAWDNAGEIGHLNCRSESYGQLHENFDNYNVLGDRDDACKILPISMWSCGVITSYAGTDVYVQVNPMYGPLCTYHPDINKS